MILFIEHALKFLPLSAFIIHKVQKNIPDHVGPVQMEINIENWSHD